MKKDRLRLIVYISGSMAILAITAYVLNFHSGKISGDSATWGTLGDFTGGVIGTVFSFASVILIYLTFQRQQETSVLQQFETTFFNLLNIQREMMKSVKADAPVIAGVFQPEGQAFFEKLAAELTHDYQFSPTVGTKDETRNIINEYYEERFAIAGPTLGPYYRHLYHFIKYTNSSQIFNQKQKYMDIIQAQMSDAELYCLFYNGICYGSEKLLPLLDTYAFLENIERKTLVFDSHKKMFYPNTNFKYHSRDVVLSENN